MANYFTNFSCLLDVGTVENAKQALDLYEKLTDDLEREESAAIGFSIEHLRENGDTQLWIHGDEYGDPDHVVRFVQQCAEAFKLKGRWGFEWSYGCTIPHLDAFGGGALVLDLETGANLGSLSTSDWLAHQLGLDSDQLEGDCDA